jgi:hypothetical protein
VRREQPQRDELPILLQVPVSFRQISPEVSVATSCRGKADETISEVRNGAFKVLIRSQEFHRSGIRNVDVCVATISSLGFPENRVQCFLHGFDFDGLTAKWQSPQAIEVAFRSGRVLHFTNFAVVYTGGPVPTEFHVILCDGWEAATR